MKAFENNSQFFYWCTLNVDRTVAWLRGMVVFTYPGELYIHPRYSLPLDIDKFFTLVILTTKYTKSMFKKQFFLQTSYWYISNYLFLCNMLIKYKHNAKQLWKKIKCENLLLKIFFSAKKLKFLVKNGGILKTNGAIFSKTYIIIQLYNVFSLW